MLEAPQKGLGWNSRWQEGLGDCAAENNEHDATGMQNVSTCQGFVFGMLIEATPDYMMVDGRASARMIRSDSAPLAEAPFATNHKVLVPIFQKLQLNVGALGAV